MDLEELYSDWLGHFAPKWKENILKNKNLEEIGSLRTGLVREIRTKPFSRYTDDYERLGPCKEAENPDYCDKCTEISILTMAHEYLKSLKTNLPKLLDDLIDHHSKMHNGSDGP